MNNTIKHLTIVQRQADGCANTRGTTPVYTPLRNNMLEAELSPPFHTEAVRGAPPWRQFVRHLVVLATLFTLHPTKAADSLIWDSKADRVHASVETWDLETLLGKIAVATGWEIYLEPDSKQKVSVRFKNLEPSDALKRMLGDLNFALLSQANGPSKLLIYRTSLGEATQRIQAPKEPKKQERKGVVPNELVVTLKPGSGETIEELAERLGAKIIGRVDDLNSYRLQFEDEDSTQKARDILSKNEDFARVDSNYYVNNPAHIDPFQETRPPPFTLKPKSSADSNQVIIGLIDTPLQPLPAEMSEFVLDPIHVAGNPGNLGEELTHGTSMAETILRGTELVPQSPDGSNVRILPVDVYGPNPETTTFDVANGIYAAVNAGANVINLSMGGSGDSAMLADLINQANQNGVLFFGAAGNEPTPQLNFPAAYSSVIAVTAGNRRGEIAPYANYGSFVDVVAPGVSFVDFNGDRFIITGTSSSTAYISGTAAGILESGKPPAEVADLIIESFAPKPSRIP